MCLLGSDCFYGVSDFLVLFGSDCFCCVFEFLVLFGSDFFYVVCDFVCVSLVRIVSMVFLTGSFWF